MIDLSTYDLGEDRLELARLVRAFADEVVDFARPRASDLIADPAFVQQRARLLAALGA